MLIIKVFGTGENREERIEDALIRFLFPGRQLPKRKEKADPAKTLELPSTPQTPPGKKPELGIGN